MGRVLISLERHRNVTGTSPENCRRNFIKLTPQPEAHPKLKQLAQQQGLTLNALLVPYLNDIAAGRLTRGSQWGQPAEGNKAA